MTSHDNDDAHDSASGPLLGLLAGFACGLAAGAAVGLLFAPAPGSDTRARILAEGRAARRRTAAWFDRQAAMEIVRRRGVRGLLDALQSRAPRGTTEAV